MARIHGRTVQKDLHDPHNHDDVLTILEPDILECEVKRALGSITTNKANGENGETQNIYILPLLAWENRDIWKTHFFLFWNSVPKEL